MIRSIAQRSKKHPYDNYALFSISTGSSMLSCPHSFILLYIISCYCVLEGMGFMGCSVSEWVQSFASAETAEKGVTCEGSFVRRQLTNKTHTQTTSLLHAGLRAAITS